MDDQGKARLAQDMKIVGGDKMKKDPESLAASYHLSPEEARFFKAEMGIDNDDVLKMHILEVQARAHKILPYLCIKGLTFLRLGIATLPEYDNIIKLGKERLDGVLLDVGCCFGVDARKAVSDGFPLKNTVITDLKKEFHELGHALFKTTPETYSINFVHGDAFNPSMLQIVPPFDQHPSTEKPDLAMLKSLNPLAGRCAVIYAANFFHLFSEENQLHMAKALAGLLSPEPGSMICGEHVGSFEKRVFQGDYEGMKFELFQHSPESWTALWDGEVFEKGKVRVDAKIVGKGAFSAWVYDRLQWSVVRL